MTNTSSAHCAAKAWPRPDWPAWISTGWPCGDRGTLNGPRERKYLPDVVQPMHLRRIGETVVLLVQNQGIVFPGIPMAHDDLHELIGAVVARVVFHVFGVTEVQCLGAVQRRNDVPGDAALQHQVHRREHPRHMVRLVIGGGIRRSQAEL